MAHSLGTGAGAGTAVSRRTALVGALAALIAAGGCQGERWYPSEVTPDEHVLRGVIAAKRRMIARYEATLDGTEGNAELLRALLEDHQSHLKALEKRLPERDGPAAQQETDGSASPPAKPEKPVSTAALRVAEESAAGDRARQASRISDANLAQLIAGIGGSEAGHAHQLSETR